MRSEQEMARSRRVAALEKRVDSLTQLVSELTTEIMALRWAMGTQPDATIANLSERWDARRDDPRYMD